MTKNRTYAWTGSPSTHFRAGPRGSLRRDRSDAAPGLAVSIQTFGSYAANFRRHVHALVTDGASNKEGEFLLLPDFDARLVEEAFRRRVLERLHRAQRLSEELQRSLLGWVHSGFSVHGEQTVPTDDLQGAERLARYLIRGPLPLDVTEKIEGGRLRVRTPPDPRTGLAEKVLDSLDLIHALTTQIPDPGQHLVRYYGWYSNRSRGARAALRRSTRPSSRDRSRLLARASKAAY